MTIDWLDPSDDVTEARRVGYDECREEMIDEIEALKAEIVRLKEVLGVF